MILRRFLVSHTFQGAVSESIAANNSVSKRNTKCVLLSEADDEDEKTHRKAEGG